MLSHQPYWAKECKGRSLLHTWIPFHGPAAAQRAARGCQQHQPSPLPHQPGPGAADEQGQGGATGLKPPSRPQGAGTQGVPPQGLSRMDQSPKALPCLCPLPSLCTRSGLVLPGTLVPPQEAGGASSSSSTDPARSPEVRHRRLNSFKQPDWSKEDTGWPGAPARPLRLPRRAALSWEPTAPPTELPWHCCKKAHSSAHPHHPPGGWHRRRERRATLQPAQREARLWGGGRAASPNKAVHGMATLEGALLWGR